MQASRPSLGIGRGPEVGRGDGAQDRCGEETILKVLSEGGLCLCRFLVRIS